MQDRRGQISTIDLHFQSMPNVIAAFLIESSAGPVLIETGPHSCIDHLEAGIREAGYTPEDIEHVFITHIHLDHAGSAWKFARHGAKIYLHPFGQRHMADPSRFLASAKMIYGDLMDALWGEVHPIAEEQLVIVDDGASIQVGDLEVISHHTPGHAKHHISWQIDNVIFAGDVAGISIQGGPIIPPCPPPDIDIQKWIESIQKMEDIKDIDAYYLGHFGKIENIGTHMQSLITALHQHADFIEPYYRAGKSVDEVIPDFQEFTKNYLISQGLTEEEAQIYEASNPSYMGAYGLMRYWSKFEEQKNLT